MKLPEQTLWKRLASNLAQHPACRGIRFERVETIINDGMPDVLACTLGVVTWLELKYVSAWPERERTKVLGDKGLSIAERNWHLSWRNAGGSVATLIGIGSYEYTLIDARWSDQINDFTRWDLFDRATIAGKRDIFFPALGSYLRGNRW
jgi:hypothetical protein